MEDPKKILEAVAGAIEIAGNTPEARQAARNVGASAVTLTAFIDNCLLPLAVVNFAFAKGKKYFLEKFPSDLAERTKLIPEENLTEPKASVAAPVIQGLIFAHDEDGLRELYINLLASAMNSETSSLVHPAFSDIIRQLGVKDARILKELGDDGKNYPVAELSISTPGESGKRRLYRNLLGAMFIDDQNGMTFATGWDDDIPVILDNLVRLGLLTISYEVYLTGEDAYSWIEHNPKYVGFKHGAESSGKVISYTKGCAFLTDFGKSFVDIVVK